MFHLGWFHYESVPGWGTDDYNSCYDWSKPALHQDLAKELEAACFDFILLEDSSAIPNEYGGTRDIYLTDAVHAPKFDPAVMAGLMVAATSRIGIVPTLTTTFYPPFILSRLTQTLDLMSGGRVGWNIVSSSSDLAARNFGMPSLPEHDSRYDIADEYLDVCKQLWCSWKPDAVLADAESGTFADPTKVRQIDFHGEHYQVMGPLNVPPSPQGRPVLAQAGNSERGRRFAARHADIVLTPVNYPPAIKAFRDDIRRLAVEEGRNPDEVKVMPVAFPRVFETEAEVARYRVFLDNIPDRVARGWVAQVSAITGLDLSVYSLDEVLPAHVQTNGSRGTLDWLRGGNATIRQIGLRFARLTPDEPLVGTAAKVAKEMGEVMELVGGDGFLLSGGFTSNNVQRITQLLIPELQKQSLVRSAYQHQTLRDELLAF